MNAVKIRTCPYCGAKVSGGKPAMKRHLAKHTGTQSCQPSAVLGTNTQPASAQPGRRRRNRRQVTGNGVQAGRVASGTDVIGVVTMTAPGTVGSQLMVAPINPEIFAGTRLRQESTLWTRWVPSRLQLKVVPSAGTFCTGSYIAGWTPDTSEYLPSGTDAVRKVGTFSVQQEAHISAPITLNIPVQSSRKWYDRMPTPVSPDNTHGRLVVVLAAPVSNLTGDISFTFHLSWTLRFDGPDVDSEKAVPGTHIVADPGYSPYFTDSSSDWFGGERLTLKAHEGGSIVSFSAAKLGVVYRIDAAARLAYVADDGKAGFVEYAARAANYTAYPILALFGSLETARAYAANPGANYTGILKYKAAGGVVVPANPVWNEVAVAQTPLLDLTPVALGSAHLDKYRSLEAQVDQLTYMVRTLLAQRGRSPSLEVLDASEAPSLVQESGNPV